MFEKASNNISQTEKENENKSFNVDELLNNYVDSSLDSSSLTIVSEYNKKTFQEDFQFITEGDEVDWQFDEMMELMEEMQGSGTGGENNFDSEGKLDDSPARTVVSLKDFKFVRELGSGLYGRVDIYRKIKTNDEYAIKTINIEKMVKFKKIYFFIFNLEIEKCKRLVKKRNNSNERNKLRLCC